MSKITAVLHTKNDALRLGRALEGLYPCDHILVIDHGSRDSTVKVAREYGAHVLEAQAGASGPEYTKFVPSEWILCVDARESLTESLAASLYEWKLMHPPAAPAFSVFLREETAHGWVDVHWPQTRLVPTTWKRWDGTLPETDHSALALSGSLLRFAFP
jgi:hypothetical protein